MAKVRYRGLQRNLAQELLEKVKKEVEPVLDKGISIRERYTAGWSDDNKPRFYKDIRIVGDKLKAEIKFDAPPAESSTEGKSVYELLRDGTEVRRVNLSHDWQSKTSPNSLSTKSGRGQVVDIKPYYEFPGIKARNTDQLANEEIQDELQRAVQRAVAKS